MSDFTDFLDQIRSWAMRPDLSDDVVTSFVRMAEASLNNALFVKESLVIATETVDAVGRVTLPSDFRSMDYLRRNGGTPLRFVVKDDYMTMEDNTGYFTIIGQELLVGGEIGVDGIVVEMGYYTNVPVFSDAATWLYSKYYNIYLQSALAAAAMYSRELEQATSLAQAASALVQAANELSHNSQIGGGVLKKRVPVRIG